MPTGLRANVSEELECGIKRKKKNWIFCNFHLFGNVKIWYDVYKGKTARRVILWQS
jgi:hypothetical protein